TRTAAPATTTPTSSGSTTGSRWAPPCGTWPDAGGHAVTSRAMRLRPIAAAAAVLALAPAAASAAWSGPVRVSPSDGALHGAPSAALGAEGEAVAAWLRRPARAARGAARVQVAE